MDEKTYELQFPIKIEKDGVEEEIKELKLGRIKGKHLKKIPKDCITDSGISMEGALILICQSAIPVDWKESIWAIAYFYHFPPNSIWEMDLGEINFWERGIEKISQQMRKDYG
jgi:hypothetical protein